VLLVASLIAKDPGDQPDDGLCHDEDGDLASDEHIVADADLLDAVVAGGVVDDSLVDPLVAAPGAAGVLFLAPQGGRLLREGFARGRGDDDHGAARCGGTASVAVIPPFSPACRIRVVEGCQLLVGEGGLEVACGGCGSGARDDVVQGGAPYAGLHHHAGTTAIGGVVDGLVARSDE